MAVADPDAQTQETTNLRTRAGMRCIYLHFTDINDTDTFDLGMPVSHAAWEGDTDGDVAQLSVSGSVATLYTSGTDIDGAMVIWTQDRKV